MHKLEIKSDISNISEVEKLIDVVCEDLKLNEDNYGNILIAVTEAVTNAIIHGNQNNPIKSVTISVDAVTKEVVFTVVDEGGGFDFTNLPDPTAPDNLEKPNGRGVFLMKNLSDKVEFFDEGRKVCITFVING